MTRPLRPLTDRQHQVLAFFVDYTRENGMPPTIRDVGQHFGFSPRAAYDHVRRLVCKGMLRHRGGGRSSRSYSLAPAPVDA